MFSLNSCADNGITSKTEGVDAHARDLRFLLSYVFSAIDLVHVSQEQGIVTINLGLEILSTVESVLLTVDDIRGRDLDSMESGRSLINFLETVLVTLEVHLSKLRSKKIISYQQVVRG